MGYYSLYRIVKDITRTIFGHKFWRKFLIVCLLAFAIWFFMHSKGYCVDETEDVNYAVYNYYDSLLDDLILRLGNLYETNPNHAIFTQLKDNTNNYFAIAYYGNNDGSSYLGGIPLNKRKLSFRFANFNTVYANTPTTYDYLGVTGVPIYKYGSGDSSYGFYQFDGSNFTTVTVTNFYFPTYLYGYRSSNWLYFIQSLRNNDTQSIIELLEDIKEETQTTNDILTDSSIDNSVISDLNSGYTATSEDITNNDTTFQLGETKENAWLTQFKTAFNGLSYRLPSTINLTLPYVNKNLGIRSDILSSHITGTQFETIVIAFWWVFFGMRIYRLVKRIVIHFASGEILNSEAHQSGPWKLHELLQYEIDRVGLDTFI